MATRRMETLIRHIRAETGNQSYSSTSGISQRDICDYLSTAQARLQAAILNSHPRGAFTKTTTLDVTAGTNEVALPSDFHYSGGIITAEFSANGTESSYYELDNIGEGQIVTSVRADPSDFARQGSSLILSPIPQSTVSDGLRIRYVKRLPRLDVRRGTVSAVTLNSGASTITSLTLTTGATLDSVALLEDDHICVVSSTGTIKMKAIPITAINTGTGAVTVSTFVYEAGETIAAGDYVVSGKYATTHSELPEDVEDYLVEFAKWKLKKRDANDDSMEESQELQDRRAEIVEDFTDLDRSVQRIPEL